MENREMTKGNYVAYGTNGICEIEDVKPLSFTSGAEKSLYYILRPANSQGSTIFVPAGNETLTSRIRSLMTKDEIDALLTGMRDKELAWEQDRRFRTENFHEILMKGVQQELLLMIRCIYLKKQELEASGKKPQRSWWKKNFPMFCTLLRERWANTFDPFCRFRIKRDKTAPYNSGIGCRPVRKDERSHESQTFCRCLVF